MTGTSEKALLLKECEERDGQIAFLHQGIGVGGRSAALMEDGDGKCQIRILPGNAGPTMAKGIFHFISVSLFPPP